MANAATAATRFNALQGRWSVVYQEIDGEVAGPLATILELQGDSFKVERDGKVVHEGTFTVGPGPHAEEIVLIYQKTPIPSFSVALVRASISWRETP